VSDHSLLVQPLFEFDVGAAIELLASRDLVDNTTATPHIAEVCRSSLSMCLCARRGRRIVGVALAVFNGFHVFLSHIAVATDEERQGLGALLVEQLKREAAKRGARGIIADAQFRSVHFFAKQGFRLPGVVFMIADPG
jgi:N-acetylglutamate synthase-like GNAT family acetyltransferase